MASDSSPGSLKELATSRARFIAELGERLASIRQGLARVGASAEANAELNAVRRRLHALAAAANVLHFTAAADALGRAQTELAALASAPSPAPAREKVARILDLVPSLALGAAIDLRDEIDGERARSPREPLSVLVFGDAALEAALHKPGPLHRTETFVTSDPDQLPALVTRLGPDVLLLDGDDERVFDALPRLRQAAASSPFSLVAVGNFESYEGMLRLVRRGISRVLPKPLDAASLQRTLQRLVPREPPSSPRPNPFEGAGSDALVEVIGSEARKAFADPHPGATPAPALAGELGDQALAALWSAFARIRLLATRGAEGNARFPLEGPYGMIPLAPALAESRNGSRDSSVSEALAGRRFVVADADPTLLGALTRTLQRLGASVLPARDGAQALELCERQWPDALITDALLPTASGFALCKKIRDDIALADLPVAVICWKEHLLEHARRLTEHQHGGERPLDPEAFGPLAEALSKRMGLERRLERHDAVHGRIDGLTPRLLLQLACSRTPSALLSLRAARLTLEIAVVDGRPVHARLMDGNSVAAEGPAALGPFLGMRVGRFSMVPLSTAPPAHFSGDVMTVLAPAVARARRARAWLASADALELERAEVEPRVAALYLEEAPAAHKSVVNRLLRGESLRALWDPADASGSDKALVVALLTELGRRGGLLALIDKRGHDVLDPDLRSSAPRGARSQDAPTAVVLPAALSLAEAVLQAVSAPLDHSPDRPSARRTHPGLAPPAPPVEPYRSRKSNTPPMPDAELGDGRRGSVPPPAPDARRASVIPTAPDARRASVIPPAPDFRRASVIPTAPDARRASVLPPAPDARRASVIPPAPDARRASIIPPAPDARRASVIPPAPDARRASIIPPAPDARRASVIPPAPLDRRRASVVPPAPDGRRASVVPPAPDGRRASVVPPAPDARRASVVPPAPSEGRISSVPMPLGVRRASAPPPAPAEGRRSSVPTPPDGTRASVLPPTPSGSRISSLPPSPEGRRRTSVVPMPPASARPPSRPSSIPPAPRGARISLPPSLERERPMDTRTSIVPPEPAALDSARDGSRDMQRRASEPREVTEAWSSEPEDEDTLPGDKGEAETELDDEPPRTFGARARAVLGPVVVTLGAAGLAFAGMRVIMGGALEDLGVRPSTEVLGNLAADAGYERPSGWLPAQTQAFPTPPDAGDASGPALPGVERPIPLDIELSSELLEPLPEPRLIAGHGMLEVRTWEPQRIYVDGVFVGNYATRFVPLKPGSYRLRLLAGSREVEQSVQIQTGRRTRVVARAKSAE
jgi:CheY-like chemotaxis protein